MLKKMFYKKQFVDFCVSDISAYYLYQLSRKGINSMRRIMRQIRTLFSVIKEELILLDKRTDVLPMLMSRVNLNDDDYWDDESDDDSGDTETHLGIVSLTLYAIALISIWMAVSVVLIFA